MTRWPTAVDTLFIRGIDVTASKEDRGGAEPHVRIVVLRETPKGTQTARVEVAQKFASLILRAGYKHRSKECNLVCTFNRDPLDALFDGYSFSLQDLPPLLPPNKKLQRTALSLFFLYKFTILLSTLFVLYEN